MSDNLVSFKAFEADRPLTTTVERPLISFCLFSYKQEKFIREAIEGAFAQTYSPLEIILSDDCSPDRTFDIMREMAEAYRGPHRLILNRNAVNLGLVPHFNLLMGRAAGEIVVLAAGDDVSLPDRTEKSWRLMRDYPDATCISMGLERIDANGHPLPYTAASLSPKLTKVTLEKYLRSYDPILYGASRAFRKEVWARFGPLRAACPTEDSPMRLRCLMLGNGYYCNDYGIRYRVHGNNISGNGGVFTLSPINVIKQYNRDIRLALREGMISSAVATQGKRYARRLYERRILLGKLHKAPSLRFVLTRIFPSRAFPPGEKMRMLASYALRALRGKRN